MAFWKTAPTVSHCHSVTHVLNLNCYLCLEIEPRWVNDMVGLLIFSILLVIYFQFSIEQSE
jgi:hypothetical protein